MWPRGGGQHRLDRCVVGSSGYPRLRDLEAFGLRIAPQAFADVIGLLGAHAHEHARRCRRHPVGDADGEGRSGDARYEVPAASQAHVAANQIPSTVGEEAIARIQKMTEGEKAWWLAFQQKSGFSDSDIAGLIPITDTSDQAQ